VHESEDETHEGDNLSRGTFMRLRWDNPLPTSIQEAGPFISTHFLKEDGSALQFSVPHLAVLATENLDTVAQRFYARYLETYDWI